MDLLIKKVINESITDKEFELDPKAAKYTIKIEPIISFPLNKKFCIILLDKRLSIGGFPVPFTNHRKAIISEDEDQELKASIINEFPGYDYYDIRFQKDSLKRYPYCRIQKYDPSNVSFIEFQTANQLNEWIRPIERAILQFKSEHF